MKRTVHRKRMELFPEHTNFRESSGSKKIVEQSVESFFKVFNASPGGMCLTNNSVLVEVNKTYELLFGFSHKEAIGKTNLDLGTLTNEEFQRIQLILLEKGNLVDEEIQLNHKDGTKVHCLVTTMPVVLGGRELTLSSFNDITRVRKQSEIIARQHRDLLDSMHYAKRIQDALFPTKGVVKELLPNSFILLKRRAIVTGDFYWIEKKKDKIYIAVADCSGPGVPGALMSIVGFNLLNAALKEQEAPRPADILNYLSTGVFKTLKQDLVNEGAMDGIDISIVVLDQKEGLMEYAGARQAVYCLRKNELIKLIPDRFPAGIHAGKHLQEFNNQQFRLNKNDIVYLFTDGYLDQFGGLENKKFKNLQFQKLLLSLSEFSMEEQSLVLEKTFDDWKGDQEQVDDALIIGIKIA
jgi:PAS domain S-box-containing protein